MITHSIRYMITLRECEHLSDSLDYIVLYYESSPAPIIAETGYILLIKLVVYPSLNPPLVRVWKNFSGSYAFLALSASSLD